MLKPRYFILIAMIVLTAASRLLAHPPNFTPLAAMALFGGAYITNKRFAFLVPLAAMFLSDLVIGFHEHVAFVYGGFAIIVCMGFLLRQQRSIGRVAGVVLSSSVLFFILTNFGVWAIGSLYLKTWDGLLTCYVAAIPFFRNALAGNLVFSAVLFTAFEFMQQRWPVLRETSMAKG